MSEYSFKLPDLGEGSVESEIVEWHIAVGDIIAKNQHIADVQTDKAVIEATTPVAGKVLKLGCNAGEMLSVGSELVLLETDAQAAQKNEAVTAKNTNTEPHTDNNTVITAAVTTPETSAPVTTTPDPNSDSSILTSPSVRLRARQENIDLHDISGSGPKGRISHQDLDAFLSGQPASPQTKPAATQQVPAPKATNETTSSKVTTADDSAVKRYTLSGTRRIIAQRMLDSMHSIPHYSYVEEVDVTQLEKRREQLNSERSDSIKLTLLPFIIKALTKALPEFPHCNAHFNSDSNEVSEYKNIHVGIATMTDNGLMVPVIKNCESKDLWQLAEAIEQLANGARNQSLSPKQLTGSTITITSLGKLGGIASTPIINAPETSIIGINKIQKRPVVIDDAIAIHSMMNISASFDHRIVDGYDGASLVQQLKRHIEANDF